MSLAQTPLNETDAGALPGLTMIRMIRRLLIVSLVAALVYPAFMTSSRGYCAGGFDGSGGFIDMAGRAMDEAPRCIQLTLKPSPLVYVAIALIVLIAINRVVKAADEPAALRTLRRATIAVGVLVAVAIVISQVWFQMTPIEDFNSGSWSVVSPFPFGFIDVTDTPMTAP